MNNITALLNKTTPELLISDRLWIWQAHWQGHTKKLTSLLNRKCSQVKLANKHWTTILFFLLWNFSFYYFSLVFKGMWNRIFRCRLTVAKLNIRPDDSIMGIMSDPSASARMLLGWPHIWGGRLQSPQLWSLQYRKEIKEYTSLTSRIYLQIKAKVIKSN